MLDVYRPPQKAIPKLRLAILLLHGGGWQHGSKRDMRKLGIALSKAGFVCFSADYRLVEGHLNRHPAALDDARRAVRWIRIHAASYSVDPHFIGAAGASSGGQLSALLGTTDTRDNSGVSNFSVSSRVQAVVDVCGINDLKRYVASTPQWANIVTDFLGGTPQQVPQIFREATPISWVSPQSASFLIVHGGRDQLVPLEQSQRLLTALRKAKVPASLSVFRNQGHGIPQDADFEKFIRQTTRFLRLHLRQKLSPRPGG
jgi:acetyl esterase/lipase